jgi:hypothetical protein
MNYSRNILIFFAGNEGGRKKIGGSVGSDDTSKNTSSSCDVVTDGREPR